MNCDDIIRMARNDYGIYAFTAESLAEFAALVAAAEREACAKVCIEIGATKANSDDGLDIADLCAAAIRARGEK